MPTSHHPVPLMPGFRPGRVLVRRRGKALTYGAVLTQAIALAQAMPAAPWVVNLCQDRGLFLLALCAALVRGVRCLLPPSPAARAIEELASVHPGAICLCDEPLDDLTLPQWLIQAPTDLPAGNPSMPAIARAWESVFPFTSGSTGRPQAHPKRWGDLMTGAREAGQRFSIGADATIVATVPAQHMYGLELSVLLPLAIGAATDASRPFFPEDVRLALGRVPAPRILVTTPVHLAACVQSMGPDWPPVHLVISATAPLATDLVRRVEQRLGTRVCEIYGCTEAGSLASRRTLSGPDWLWYDSVSAQALSDGVTIAADFLPAPVRLSDVLTLRGDRTFRLLGRDRDLVKIAGKRASLTDLNTRLNSIPGVLDGAFAIPAEDGREVQRLAVVVVAPGFNREGVIQALRGLIDPAFLPRHLMLVDRLPRNETGKLPRERLLELLRSNGWEGQ